ncbi:MAG: Arc family DNA-binding protein [Cardiobacterium sp.]
MNGQEYQISLRLPRDLKEQLERRAAHNWRSLNGEILAMLEDYQKILEQKNL